MSVFLQPIYTQTVGAGGTTLITFNNIPQTFTDLLVVVSARTAFAANYQYIQVLFNNNSSSYSATSLYGSGSAVSTNRNAQIEAGAVSANATSNTFSNVSIYIPNYTSSNFKSYIADGVAENNSTAGYDSFTAGLWSNTSTITRVDVSGAGQTIVQNSTATLYGVLRQGV